LRAGLARPEGVTALIVQLHLLDAGHFALETHAGEIATSTLEFLARTPAR
jgi:hypothetical protein